jgi:Ser/Thr protein kinase RdoA (MazF antagonist)
VLPDEVRGTLLGAYDLGDWLVWQRTPKGSSNVSFFVTTSSGKYVLRCSNSRKSEASLRFEVRLIEYLRRRGYPAPEIIPSREGEAYAQNGGSFYLMTAFIPGGRYDPSNREHLLAAGRGLGRYHRLVRDLPGPYYCRPFPLPHLGPHGLGVLAEVDRLAQRFLSAEERNRLGESLANLRDQFPRVQREVAELYPRLSQLVIQGSFGRSALLFDGAMLTGVVDYDRAALEIRGLDLVYAIKAFCRSADEHRDEYWIGLDYGRCRAFLAAYREEESLPREETHALPLIFRGQRLVKVLHKCGNLLAKNAVVPQQLKDVRKLALMAEREASRLRWLEAHSNDLLAAFLD